MKKLTFLGLSIAVAAVFSACNQKTEGTDAVVEEAKEVEEVAATAVDYSIDTSTSHVTYIGSKVGGKHNGTIPVSGGTISTEDGSIVAGKITIDMTSIDNEDLEGVEGDYGEEGFLKHLRSPEFFDVEKYPTATFEVTSVELFDPNATIETKEEYESENKPMSADEFMVEGATHTITGNLTMKDVTKSITFPAKVSMEDGNINAEAKFNIDRTVWNVKYGDEASAVDKAKDKFVYNTVNVGFDIKANSAVQ